MQVMEVIHGNNFTDWRSEIGSLTSLDACNSGASSDRRKPISLHQSVPQRSQLQNYLKRDLAELENYLWAQIEPKTQKKKKIAEQHTCTDDKNIGPSMQSRLSRFHPPFYLLECFSSFLRQKRHVLFEVGLKSSFFDTLGYVARCRRTFGLLFGETNSK